MFGIKDLISQNIVNSSVNKSSQSYKTTAEVLEISESRNLCRIKYRNAKSKLVIEDEIPVKLIGNENGDWFPDKGEIVMVEEVKGKAIITGIYYEDYEVDVKSRCHNEKDIYAENVSSDNCCGNIF